MRSLRPAYTLFEMTLVVALVAILAALGYPSLDSAYNGMKVDAGVDAVRAAWAEARSHAVNEGQAYRFSVNPGKGTYRVAPDSADYWTGNDTPTPDDPTNPPLVLEDSLPKPATFCSTNGQDAQETDEGDSPKDEETVEPSSLVTGAVFLPDGTAQDDADIALGIHGQRWVTLHLRGLTGIVTVVREGG